MIKYLALFSAIFICVFCAKKTPDEDFVEYDTSNDIIQYYNQILLKKWRENANWQEQEDYFFGPTWISSTRGISYGISDDSVWNTAEKALKNITILNIKKKTLEVLCISLASIG